MDEIKNHPRRQLLPMKLFLCMDMWWLIFSLLLLLPLPLLPRTCWKEVVSVEMETVTVVLTRKFELHNASKIWDDCCSVRNNQKQTLKICVWYIYMILCLINMCSYVLFDVCLYLCVSSILKIKWCFMLFSLIVFSMCCVLMWAATEVRSAKTYWHVQAGGGIYPGRWTHWFFSFQPFKQYDSISKHHHFLICSMLNHLTSQFWFGISTYIFHITFFNNIIVMITSLTDIIDWCMEAGENNLNFVSFIKNFIFFWVWCFLLLFTMMVDVVLAQSNTLPRWWVWSGRCWLRNKHGSEMRPSWATASRRDITNNNKQQHNNIDQYFWRV